jgi:multicomponent Na+:H+ antiporter subunit B
VTGAALFYGTLDMPNYGDPDAPANKHVAPRYIEESGREIGVPNIVTSVLASYRGYDTLGETVVIFTAAIGVMILLGRGRDRWRPGLRRDAARRREDEV